MMLENDPTRDADDAALDELLSQARWPEPSVGSEARLRAAYLQVRAPRQSNWMLHAVTAMAAVLAIACGIWFVAQSQHKPSGPIVLVPQWPSVPSVPVTQAEKVPLVRTLGPAERLVLIADKRERAARKATQQQPAPPKDPLAQLRRLDSSALTRMATATTDAPRRRDAISVILERNDLQSFLYFVLRPSTRDDAIAVLHAMPNPPTQELLAELNHQQVDYRLAAAKALGGICNHEIDRKLMTMVATNNHRREALAALLSCSDPRAKQMLTMAQAYASADEIRSVQHDLNKTF
jgi:hypothetical protein